MADAKMLNLARVNARLGRLPERIKKPVRDQLKKEVDDLTEAIKRAAPVDATAHHDPLGESVHNYENPDRDLSYRILADAKDEQGRFIGSHVEQGHRAVDGTHVPARPFFFPTYRARKKGIRSRINKAARDAIKALWTEG